MVGNFQKQFTLLGLMSLKNSNHWLQTVITFSYSVVMFGKLIAYIHDMKASQERNMNPMNPDQQMITSHS
jgi:hypothetical protein